MLIHLHRDRKDYFESFSPTEILRNITQFSEDQELKDKLQAISQGERKNISNKDLKKLAAENLLVLGTSDSLEKIVNREECQRDDLALLDQIEGLNEKQALFLPNEYAIPNEEAKDVMVYTPKKYRVKIDGAPVIREIFSKAGKKVPSTLSAKLKQEIEWSPEKVIKTKFDQIHKKLEELIEEGDKEKIQGYMEKIFCTYIWYSKDGHRKRVSLYRAIEAAEMVVYQNIVANLLKLMKFKKDLRYGRDGYTKKKLSGKDIEKLNNRIRRMETYNQRYGYEPFLRQLKTDFDDSIDILKKPYKGSTKVKFKVLSRSRKTTKSHKFKLASLPVLERGDKRKYSMVWDITGKDICEDKDYHEDREFDWENPDRGSEECLFCAHEMAASHVMNRYLRNGKGRRIELNPFVIPTEKTMKFVNKLRYQTFIMGENGRRKLNKTEQEILIWNFVKKHGYDYCFYNEPRRGLDAQKYLVRFAK